MKKFLVFLVLATSIAQASEVRDYILQTNSIPLQTLEGRTNIMLAKSNGGGITELNIETFEVNTERKSLEKILLEMDNRRCWGECRLLKKVELKEYSWEDPKVSFYEYITEESPTFAKELNDLLRRGTAREQKAYYYENNYHDGQTYSESFAMIVIKGEENTHDVYRVSLQQGK